MQRTKKDIKEIERNIKKLERLINHSEEIKKRKKKLWKEFINLARELNIKSITLKSKL